ncbi:hypothetical protein MTF69_25800 [Streptomyces sp. AP-93]|nr:hypothetical protein [Streptomyces sp. AP-93]
MLQRTQRKDPMKVTCVPPADGPTGPASTIGDFKDWQLGGHALTPSEVGKRAVALPLPIKSTRPFRYLAAGDYWFNDDSADEQDRPSQPPTRLMA